MSQKEKSQKTKNNHAQKASKKKLDSYAKYYGIAFKMLAIIFLGVFGGIKADELLLIKFPVFTVVLSLLSVSLSIYVVIKDL